MQNEVLLAPILYDPSREALANQICGALQGRGFSSGQQGVVRVMIAHTGFHSNRVWCSQERLAALAQVSLATVKRTVAKLKQWVSILRGDALAGGPGPHLYAPEKRISENDTNCYDLSGLLQLLPEWLQAVFKKALFGEPDQQALEVAPFDPENPQTWPDPLAGTAEPAISQEVLLSSPPGAVDPAPSLSITTPTAAMSNVDKPTVKSDPRRRKNAPEDGLRPGFFDGSKMSPINIRGDEAAKLMVATLRKQGKVGFKVAREMVAAMGVTWCWELLIYGRECGIRDGDQKGGGWYRGVWKGWEGIGWPDWFRPILTRERKALQLHKEAGAEAASQAPAQAAPAPLPASEQAARRVVSSHEAISPQKSPPVGPQELDPADIEKLLKDVHPRKRPGLKVLIRQHGIGSPEVLAALGSIKNGGNNGA